MRAEINLRILFRECWWVSNKILYFTTLKEIEWYCSGNIFRSSSRTFLKVEVCTFLDRAIFICIVKKCDGSNYHMCTKRTWQSHDGFYKFYCQHIRSKIQKCPPRNFLKNEVIAALLCSILQRRQAFGNLSN